MSEVLGDAEPFDDPGSGAGRDGYEWTADHLGAPGAARRFVVEVATLQSLALASIVLAVASLLNLSAVVNVASAFALRHPLSTSIANNVEPIGALVVAIIAIALAIVARRRCVAAAQAVHSPGAPQRLTTAVSGAAIIVGCVSILLSAAALAISLTGHLYRPPGISILPGAAPAGDLSNDLPQASSSYLIEVSPAP